MKVSRLPFFFMALIGAVIVVKITFTLIEYITHFSVRDFVSFVSTELKSDKKGRTHILLLGTGGGEHDGADLTDTIMLASLHSEQKKLSILSIPRDLWLDLPLHGSSRINKIYEILKAKMSSKKALKILKEGIEEITDFEIPYYLKIDFESFQEVVDLLGGIDIIVQKSIYDTEYPNAKENGYETFALQAGPEHLDGKTALKYVRSRHSTSDFDRSERQQQVLKALQKKASGTSFVSSPLLVKKLLEEFQDHVETNLSIPELMSLASLGADFSPDDMVSAVLKDQDVISQGSFLYTPEREQYGGAFVLIPLRESYQSIQKFITLLIEYPSFFQEKATLEILNGTRRFGLATKVGTELIRYGFNPIHYGNAKRQKNQSVKSSYYYIRHPEDAAMTESVVKLFFPRSLKIQSDLMLPVSDADITLVLGEDTDLVPEE